MLKLDLDEEQRSLHAINLLESEYPYAASMLAYSILELFLKLSLLHKRRDLTEEEVSLDTSVDQEQKGERLTLRDAKELSDELFIQRFLAKCTLGVLENVYRMKEDKRYSPDRNDVFHLNRYLASQLGSDREYLDAQNHAHLRTAKKHLVEASKSYFREWRIVETKGQLQFRDARRLPLI
jgi:hypothetical protein